MIKISDLQRIPATLSQVTDRKAAAVKALGCEPELMLVEKTSLGRCLVAFAGTEHNEHGWRVAQCSVYHGDSREDVQVCLGSEINTPTSLEACEKAAARLYRDSADAIRTGRTVIKRVC